MAFVDLFRRLRHTQPPLAPQGIERRRSPHFSAMRPASVYVTDMPFRVIIVDISRHGAKLSTRFPRETGSTIGLTIEADGRAMVLPLRLVWDRFNDGLYEFGGEFVSLTELEASHLDHFIQEVSAERGALTQRIA